MGLFLETAIVNCNDLNKVKQSLDEISKGKPKLELNPEECKYSQSGNAVQVLLNEDCVGYEELAKDLSEKISSYVMLLYIYDEDFWGYFLYDNGREMDRFSPDPEYFGENEDSEKYSGNAEIVSKYFGVPLESIEKYIVRWTDEYYEEGDVMSYSYYEYSYPACWQMA
ncbi:MAG: hypothetical protein K2K41_08210, partial [Ruminiclostridium sp.]|nr:hypothetical protein [Ruminiclostridium sp.]